MRRMVKGLNIKNSIMSIAFLLSTSACYADCAPRYEYVLFGNNLSSRVGIAACSVTATSEDIRMVAESGFSVITHKTIRSGSMPIKSPYIYYVDAPGQLTREAIGKRFNVIDHAPTETDLAITNCYGMGSLSAEETIEDIKESRAAIGDGQILIVSVYGSGNDDQEQIDDFVRAAQHAHAGGAQVIEANLSCPNLANTALMYKQPALVREICKRITSAIPDVPLSIKVGVFDTYEQMRDVIVAAYAGGARGVCGINTLPVRVVDSEGNPVYGSDRPSSGLSGAPIHALALEFTRNARSIIGAHDLDMMLFATGGAIHPQDFDDFFEAGADIVLCATGAILNMNVALEYQMSR